MGRKSSSKKANIRNAYQSPTDKTKKVLIGISMRNPAFEGEKMAAIVRMLHESYDVQNCIILIADHLDRHNIARVEGLSPNDSTVHDLARKQGAEWLQRNGHLLKPGYSWEKIDHRGDEHTIETKVAPKILYWSDVYCTRANQIRETIIENLLNEDAEFRAEYEESVMRFTERSCKRCTSPPSDHEIDAMNKASASYIREELAVVGAFTSMDYNAYPGGLFPVASSVCEMWVKCAKGDVQTKLLVKDIQVK